MLEDELEEACQAVDPTLPEFEPIEGSKLRRANLGSWWSRGAMRDLGADREEAAAKLGLSDRFDVLPLDRQRAVVRSLLDVKVRPGAGVDRVAIEPL